MRKNTYQRIQLFTIVLTAIVLSASLYFEYVVGLTPCPLCMMQRICVLLLLVLAGISIGRFHKAQALSVVQVLVAGAGMYFALRQVWLQLLPVGTAPACMPGLDVLVRYFPWQTVVKTLFLGSGDCAEVDWSFWGISMPGWSALYFAFMALMGCLLFWQTRRVNIYALKHR